MIALWVFGNAVCAKTGNLRYLDVYLVLAYAALDIYALTLSKTGWVTSESHERSLLELFDRTEKGR